MKKVRFSQKAKQAIASFALVSMLATSQVQANVPVIDASAIAQAITQVNNQVQQIKQLQAQVKAATDNGNFAGLVDNPLIRQQLNKYLPSRYNDVFEAARAGDLGALQQVVNAAKQRENQAQSSQTGIERTKAAQLLADAQVDVGYRRLQQHANTVNDLINQINATTNISQKQDLTNSLTAQSALINNEIGQLQLAMKVAERQEAAAARQANAEAYKKVRQAQTNYNKAKYPNSLINR